MTVDPRDTLSDFRHAQQFFDAGQPAEAARLLDAVLADSPESTAALELQARALFASAQLHRAEQTLRTLLDRTPDEPWARMALARTLERQGRPDEAAGHWRIADALGG